MLSSEETLIIKYLIEIDCRRKYEILNNIISFKKNLNDMILFIQQQCENTICDEDKQFYLVDKNFNKTPAIPNLDKLILAFRLSFFVKVYKYNREHAENSSHIVDGNSNYIEKKSITRYEDVVLNCIYHDDKSVLNPIFNCKNIESNLNEHKIEYLTVTMTNNSMRGLDLRKKCFTCNYMFQINHIKKTFHFYPQSNEKNNSNTIEDESNFNNIEICKKFFIENFIIVEIELNFYPPRLLISFDELLEEINNPQINKEILFFFIGNCLALKGDKIIGIHNNGITTTEENIIRNMNIHDIYLCNVSYKKYNKKILKERMRKCENSQSPILNLSGLQLTNNIIKSFDKIIPKNVIELNISYNNEISSLKYLMKEHINRYIITGCNNLINNPEYADRKKFFNANHKLI